MSEETEKFMNNFERARGLHHDVKKYLNDGDFSVCRASKDGFVIVVRGDIDTENPENIKNFERASELFLSCKIPHDFFERLRKSFCNASF